MAKKKKDQPIDGMSSKDIKKLRAATRQVWSWSTPRKLCVARATDGEGFGRCEQCKAKTPKIYIDHVIPVGNLDSGYFKRLYVSSEGLQALCRKCHGAKTKAEKAAKKDFF